MPILLFLPQAVWYLRLGSFQILMLGLLQFESLTTVIKCGCALFLWEISCHSETSTVSILVFLEFQNKREQKKRKALLLNILWGTG